MRTESVRAVLVFFAMGGLTATGQVEIEGIYREEFDEVFEAAPTELPAGWSAVTAGHAATAVGVADETWAGLTFSDGQSWAYNAALQFDLAQTGDGEPDRGLSIYAADASEERYIEVAFVNRSAGVITELAVGFDLVLYGSVHDFGSEEKRWDGFVLQVDDGSGSGFVTVDGAEAIFESDEIDFTFDASPWTANGQGWLTANLFTDFDATERAVGRARGLLIPVGGEFRLRFVSHSGGVRPAAGLGLQQEMNIGVDNLEVIPVVSLSMGSEGFEEDFDTVLAAGATVLPPGWSAVSSSKAANAIGTSDDVWAGRQEDPPGTVWAYNAALQEDTAATGDGGSDRGLAVYATDPSNNRYVQLGLINDTGEEITALEVEFSVALYAARFDSTDVSRPRWDGLVLEYSVGGGEFVRTPLEAIFENSEVTFGAAGSPWNAVGWGWATGAMIPGGKKKAVSGVLDGVNLPPGDGLVLRWASRDDAVMPTPGSGVHQNMLVGVDDVRLSPVLGVENLAVPEIEAVLVEDGGEEYLGVRYRRTAGGTGRVGIDYIVAGVKYTVESRDAGGDWRSGDRVAGYEPVEVSGVESHGDGTETVTVRLGTAAAEAGDQLARVRISRE